MKSIILLMLSIISVNTCNNNFISLPEYLLEDLYPEFKPAYNINYWEYRNYTPIDSTTEIYFKTKDYSPHLLIPNFEITSSFRNSCHHVACYDYIIYLKNNKIEVVNNLDDLLRFIGKIDNLEEGLFLRHILAPDYYSISSEGKEIGQYRINKKEIEFILLKDELEYEQIGQYKLSINRKTHIIEVHRIKTYFEKK